ncbi:MAG: Niacin transporter NiaP [uncultured Gemmatimonadetes bacterium]|uniref:Niacin transporter NiaP n=1 Tax=uncultured Gemmatimonadota bacterium TaxID=203437 RepID=A0A6J4LX40_9BACT|nr:MAG: Niacin transporter NiaP [uncultured Gemmatimonadota bacterium]
MSTHTGVALRHAGAFWAGVAMVSAGVLAHLPEFVAASSMGYRMAGMPMSALMTAGMLLIVVGLALAAFGLIPAGSLRKPAATAGSPVLLRTMDDAPLTRQHWGLLFVLGIALVIDVMKPATLGFVVPGLKAEYGITTGQAALLPMAALTGTTIGSLIWGILADRMGRRAAILLASLLFVGTSICGFMPSFGWNLFMCFMMGTSAGGMLPIVYALMTESMPAKKRGWLVVLHGGLGTVAGYLLAAGLAALLEPHFSWRVLWFMGLPTGILLLVLNRWIPESPRFLLEHGRVEEAEHVLRRFGVILTHQAPAETRETAPAPEEGFKLFALFRPPLRLRTLTVGMYAFGWSLVNWGFLTFTPTILQDRGVAAASASRMLFWSALIAVPATVLVAYLYGYWSSRKSMMLFAGLTAATLLLFAVVDPGAGGERTSMLMPLMVLLLVGSGGVISMLSPYTAEVYPTRLRGTGSGFSAGCSKVGGILAPPMIALTLLHFPGFAVIGLVTAAPVLLSTLMLAVGGVETRDRRLEDVSDAPPPEPSPERQPALAGD